MKSIIFGLALIAAVACDVSHLQGQGWSKDETGYKYPQPPEVKFDEAAPEEPLPEEPVIEDIQVVDEAPAEEQCQNGGSGQYCCINGADNEDCFIPSEEPAQDVNEEVVEEPVEVPLDVPAQDQPSNEYLPPNNEYLPPALRKRAAQIKRQVPVRRVVQAKRQVPARRVVQVKRQTQAKRQTQLKRQAPVRRVVQATPQKVKNYRVVRRI